MNDSNFQREDRYIVIKRSDLEKVPVGYWSSLIEPIGALQAHLPRRECLVIESDWPEYDQAWRMIERRMAGQLPVTAAEELESVLHWRDKHAVAIKERDALQQRLNVADQRIDELIQRKAEPAEWGAPKTVRQLIRQLETLDQDLRPLSMLRIPGKAFEDGKDRTRAVHLSFSHERVKGQWLAPFKGDGEKVVAFWCRMEQPEPQHNFAMIGIERMQPMEYDEP